MCVSNMPIFFLAARTDFLSQKGGPRNDFRLSRFVLQILSVLGFKGQVQ